QTAKVIAALYLAFSVPIFALLLPFASQVGIPGGTVTVAVVMIVAAGVYALGAFIGAILATLLYNFVASKTGGIEFTIVDAAGA
ncbi:MAG: hypothetical protein ACXWVG_18560, partial [Telluria sp.]